MSPAKVAPTNRANITVFCWRVILALNRNNTRFQNQWENQILITMCVLHLIVTKEVLRSFFSFFNLWRHTLERCLSAADSPVHTYCLFIQFDSSLYLSNEILWNWNWSDTRYNLEVIPMPCTHFIRISVKMLKVEIDQCLLVYKDEIEVLLFWVSCIFLNI